MAYRTDIPVSPGRSETGVRPKEKTISRHYKRRRAETRCRALEMDMEKARSRGGRDQLERWILNNRLPIWTTKIEVKPARLRFHYRVVALER